MGRTMTTATAPANAVMATARSSAEAAYEAAALRSAVRRVLII